MEELATAEARSKVEKFLATETSIVTKPVDAFARTVEGKVYTLDSGRLAILLREKCTSRHHTLMCR